MPVFSVKCVCLLDYKMNVHVLLFVQLYSLVSFINESRVRIYFFMFIQSLLASANIQNPQWKRLLLEIQWIHNKFSLFFYFESECIMYLLSISIRLAFGIFNKNDSQSQIVLKPLYFLIFSIPRPSLDISSVRTPEFKSHYDIFDRNQRAPAPNITRMLRLSNEAHLYSSFKLCKAAMFLQWNMCGYQITKYNWYLSGHHEFTNIFILYCEINNFIKSNIIREFEK